MTPEVIYLVLGLGLLLASLLPWVVEGRALSTPMVVLAFGVVVGLVVPGEDPSARCWTPGRPRTWPRSP